MHDKLHILGNHSYFKLKLTQIILFFSVRIMYDKNTGRARGFGFVHFSTEHEAKCAKNAMDGKVKICVACS